MSQKSLADRAFQGAIVTLFLVLGLILFVDSIRRHGGQFVNSVYILGLGVVLALSYVAVIQGRTSESGSYSIVADHEDLEDSNAIVGGRSSQD